MEKSVRVQVPPLAPIPQYRGLRAGTLAACACAPERQARLDSERCAGHALLDKFFPLFYDFADATLQAGGKKTCPKAS